MANRKQKFPRLASLVARRNGFHALESQQDIVSLVESMQKLENSVPATATETHKIMNVVAERMLRECSSGTDARAIANSISSAVLTYSIIRDVYDATHKALSEAKLNHTGHKRDLMYESIMKSVRAPVLLSESNDMKTVFGTIFKEIGEMQLEDFDRVAKTLPDFDIFLPKSVLDQVAKKKLEQSAKRNSF